MTNKELKRLSRKELLEMLIEQSRETERLQKRLDEDEKKLKDRSLLVGEAGTLAEAAIVVNGVFEAADAAAKQYLENIAKRSAPANAGGEELLPKAREKADAIVAEAGKKADAIVAEAEKKAKKIVGAAEAEARGIVGRAEKQAAEKVREINAAIGAVNEKIRTLKQNYPDL